MEMTKVLCVLLGLTCLCVQSTPVKKQDNVRDVMATIYSDYPGIKEDITEEEVEKILALDLSLQMQALKEVLKQSDVSLENIDNYFVQNTTLSQEGEDDTSLVTNTSIMGLPDAAVVQQSQQAYDKNGDPIKGGMSLMGLAVSQDDASDTRQGGDKSEPLVYDEGAEKDKSASFGGEVAKVDPDDSPDSRALPGEEKVLMRQKRDV